MKVMIWCTYTHNIVYLIDGIFIIENFMKMPENIKRSGKINK